MNLIKVVFILSLHTLLSTQGQSQNDISGSYGFDSKERKWSLSLFTGFSALGPARDIKDQMILSGLGDDIPSYDGWFGQVPAKKYPKVNAGLVWNLEAGYTLSKKTGLQLTVGNTYHSAVEGYDNIGNGNHLRIKSNIWSAAFNYVWRIRNGKDDVTIGPVFASYKAKADDHTDYAIDSGTSSSTSAFKAGFNIGYSFSLVQKKSWFLALKANYTWLPETEIGPFTQEHQLGILLEHPETYTSTFDKTTVSLSSLNFGISTGWRF